MLNYGFATLADLKLRLGVTDTTDDALLAAILDQTAGTIEGVAGRILRRDHARVEVCNGNSDLLRVNVSPIAKVHSIRESETGDFVTAANYAELVEGTDFFIEGGQGGDSGRPGEPALIRRLGDKKWMGAWAGVAARTRVVYTGGFKTDEEKAMENSEIVISSPSDILDYRVSRTSPTSTTIDLRTSSEISVQIDNNNVAEYRAALRFALPVNSLFVPSWRIFNVTLAITLKCSLVSSDTLLRIYAVTFDPLMQGNPDAVFDSLLPANGGIPADAEVSVAADVYELFQFKMHESMSLLSMGIFQQVALDGFIGFILRAGLLVDESWTFKTSKATEDRPSLRIVHGLAFLDPFGVPDDLRNANILQAIHEYQTRKTPGMISQAMRGVSIASGASYMKTLAALLPEVEAVAMHYRRLY